MIQFLAALVFYFSFRNALSNSPSPPRRSSNSSSPLPPELSTVAQATENESTDVTAADRAQPISLPVTIDAKSSRGELTTSSREAVF